MEEFILKIPLPLKFTAVPWLWFQLFHIIMDQLIFQLPIPLPGVGNTGQYWTVTSHPFQLLSHGLLNLNNTCFVLILPSSETYDFMFIFWILIFLFLFFGTVKWLKFLFFVSDFGKVKMFCNAVWLLWFIRIFFTVRNWIFCVKYAKKDQEDAPMIQSLLSSANTRCYNRPNAMNNTFWWDCNGRHLWVTQNTSSHKLIFCFMDFFSLYSLKIKAKYW